jgi:hypothetical protein
MTPATMLNVPYLKLLALQFLRAVKNKKQPRREERVS